MLKRLQKELRTYRLQDDKCITLVPDLDLHDWTATLCVTNSESPFAGGCFQLQLRIPDDYPLDPPSITFTTPVFHPNIHPTTGEICLDVLKTEWSAVWTLQTVCLAILVLLDNPEPDSPLNCDAANLLRCGDRRAYRSMASMFTKLHAIKKIEKRRVE